MAVFTEAVAAENGLNGILRCLLCDLILQTKDANSFVFMFAIKCAFHSSFMAIRSQMHYCLLYGTIHSLHTSQSQIEQKSLKRGKKHTA